MLLSEFINLKEKPGCNMTEEGRACAVHGINECPGYKMIETSAQDKLYQRHQELRKKSGLPNPNYYKELKKTFDLPDEERHVAVAALKRKYKIDEAGPFSYGAKKPRKGSVADLAAQKRKEQEKDKQPAEPRDQRVGVAKVVKDVAEGTSTPNVVDRDGIKVSHRWNQGRLVIDALSGDGNKKLGSVYFMNYGTKEKPKFQGEELFVDERYRGQGIATIMYDMAKEILGKVYPSDAQTQAGKKFWQGKKVWEQGVAEGKVKLSTDPNYYGATIDDAGFDSLPIVNIPANRLVGFEPDDKMNQPKSVENVKKIMTGLKQGDKLPPLLVREYKQGYQVLDGHHRFWAYKQAGVKSIPVRIVPAEDIEEIGKQGVAEGHELCPECGGAMYSEEMINEKKDACYYKVKSRYKVWPSAYASGALVKCRNKGAKNWGNKSK